MLVGNGFTNYKYDGKASFVEIEPSGYKSTGLSLSQHTSTVRCCLPIHSSSYIQSFITGGEDGKVIVWKKQVNQHKEEQGEQINQDESLAESIEMKEVGDKFDLEGRTLRQQQEDEMMAEQELREQQQLHHNNNSNGKTIRLKRRVGNFRNKLRHQPY